MSGSFLCQFDHVVGHPHGLFSFGWALPSGSKIVSAHAVLGFPDGRVERVAVSTDRPREDVAAAFPANPFAANAGFLLLAGWPGDPPAAAHLEFELSDGTVESVPFALPRCDASRRRRSVGWRYLLRRSWAHVRLGRFRALVEKARRHRDRVRANARAISESELVRAISGKSCTLVVDHSMGGGANAYRDRAIEELVAAGETVVLLTFAVSTMSLTAEVRAAGSPPRAVPVGGLDDIAASLGRTRLRQMIYNCAVSYAEPLEIRSFLLAQQRATAATLRVAIHDYFVVCPSSYLLDSRGEFCGVPELARCRSCLREHADGFVSLAGERSIDRWRSAWGQLLESADEIVCFSESSRTLLDRGYPGIAARTRVVPHEVAPLRKVRMQRIEGEPLVLGVIGSILRHKGAEVVAALARAIEAEAAPVRIVVLGHVHAACPPAVVTEIGEYRRGDLPDLVERHGITMALLPSICPETFSFVAHEILSMGIPLVSLDLGAQADIARSHPLGRVAARADGPGLLADVLEFAAEIRSGSPKLQGASP